MSNIPLYYVPLAMAIGSLALIAVWSRRRRVWKTVSVALLAAVLPLGYVAYLDLLSRPKPLELEVRSGETAEVISAVLKETEGRIYLWLDVDGLPRYYEIAWQKDVAAELQAAMRQAEQTGGGVGMRLQEQFEDRFEVTDENRKPQKFYPLPVPAPPEKQRIILKSPRWEM
jgi:hypothetical protein